METAQADVCEVAECGNPPRWVLPRKQSDVAGCLCSEHWQAMRREQPQLAYLYSPLAVVRIRERIGISSETD